MTHIDQITQWLAEHKSTTLPAWLIRNPSTKIYVESIANQYNPKHIMEAVYIVLYGPPQKCQFGNQLQFDTFNKGYRKGCVLGNKCKCVAIHRMSNQKVTLIKKYGVDTVSAIPQVAEKRIATNMERYGVEFPSQSSIVKEKHKITVKKRTAEERSESLNKTQTTNIKKYGHTHHMKLQEQKDKVTSTNNKRYGSNTPLQNNEVVNKLKLTYSKRTDEQKQQAKAKTVNTLLARYGVSSASRIDISPATALILDNAARFTEFITNKTRTTVMDELQIAAHTLYLYAKKYNAADLFAKPVMSNLEVELYAYLDSNNIQYTTNNRSMISPKELDVYIPSKRIAIEIGALYWHSEMSANRDRDYHYNKHEACKKHNIQLITIFGDEWETQLAKVKQRLNHILGISVDTVYARKCEVRVISPAESKNFINTYHLQGYSPSTINLGLFYQDQLVSVMTFRKPRFTKKYEYEIIRFCSDRSVPGAASKLFLYFCKQYTPTSVVSYSDNRWGHGKVYSHMGFSEQAVNIGFYYTDYKTRFNRMKFQKHKLITKDMDQSQTADQIMQSQGYDKIWDCGQTTWIWTLTK